MCTLITVDKNSKELEQRIRADAVSNNHGWALLLIDEYGKHTHMRSLDLEAIINMINLTQWKRMFLHARFATQGSHRLENCHGWDAGGVFYFHNGVLRHPDARKYAVDSQLIGKYIRKHGVIGAFDRLNTTESFANVLAVDVSRGKYWAYHSTGGSLNTDGCGNFSTNPFGAIRESCKSGYYYPNELPKEKVRQVSRWEGGEWSPYGIYGRDDWDSLPPARIKRSEETAKTPGKAPTVDKPESKLDTVTVEQSPVMWTDGKGSYSNKKLDGYDKPIYSFADTDIIPPPPPAAVKKTADGMSDKPLAEKQKETQAWTKDKERRSRFFGS